MKKCIILLLSKGLYEIPLLVVLLVISLSMGGYDSKFISGDGHGYYAYLPNIFIYHDSGFSFSIPLQEKYYGKEHVAEFRKKVKGHYVDKYFAGVSLLWLPFFLLAHLAGLLLGNADGYSAPYQYAIGMAAVFYLGVGLYYLRRLLLTYRVSGKMAGVVLLLIVLGTNLSYFTLFDASYTHVYSFGMITAFVYYFREYLLNKKNKDLYKSLFFFGLVLVIRPVNLLIILFIPFLANDLKTLVSMFSGIRKKNLLIAFLILLPFAFYQMLWWKIQTSSWIVWSYAGESFYFSEPHILSFLFSYKKGVFIYAPVLLLSLPGLWLMSRKSLYSVIFWFIFLLVVVYVLSSWQPWWYGMSYGSRPAIDYYVCFAIPMGVGLQLLANKGRMVFIVIGFLLVGINLVQEYQYKHFILHWDKMDKSSYWKVFLRTGKKWRGYLWK